MTYLLTGATGLIGQALAKRLLDDGHSVNYLSARRSKALDTRIAFHTWPRGTVPELVGLPRLDAVVHLAGESISQRWTPAVKNAIRQSRVNGTRNLVDALARLTHKPSVLVAASAVGIYGDRGEELLTEQSGPGLGFLADVCVHWERESARVEQLGIRLVQMRIPMVLSNRGGALKLMLPAFRAGVGGRFGDGRQWMPWVHIDDLVSLIILAATRAEVAGPLNADAPSPVRNRDFTSILGKVLNRPTIMPVPMFALRLILGELVQFLIASQRVVPQKARSLGFEYRYADLEPALRNLLS